MISYAGVPLPLVTSELGTWLQAHLDVGEIEWFNALDANTPELNCSTRTRERSQPAMRLSTLIWPTDLSRFATALYVCTTQQLNQILAIVDAGKPRAPAALRIGANINTQMVLLSPVQVSGRPVDPASLSNAIQQGPPGVSQYEGLWLLPLVDERYYSINGVLYSEPTATEWKPWLEAAHTACGISCTVANVSSEFLRPGQLYYPQGNTPGLTILADSAALTIGRRYVRQLSGTYELQTYADGLAKSIQASGYQVIAGSRHYAAPMVLPYLYTFRWHNSAATAIDVSTVAGANWPANAHWRGVRTITMRCTKPSGQDTAAETFAKAWAVQHSAWRFIRHDVTYAGAVPYTLTGGDDRVEITCDSSTCTTRVYARHSEWIDSLGVLFPGQTTADGDNCGKGGGTVAGPENCPRVSNVTCVANMLVATYQLACETVSEPELLGTCPKGAPVGSIVMWAKEPLPTGWLECNGAEFDATEYPELFDLYGDNITPNLNGMFVRARGGNAGALNPFNTAGSALSTQPYGWKTAAPRTPFTVSTAPNHTHTNAPGSAINQGGGGTNLSGYDNTGTTSAAGTHTHTVTGGDNETVPDHRVLLYIVKAKS